MNSAHGERIISALIISKFNSNKFLQFYSPKHFQCFVLTVTYPKYVWATNGLWHTKSHWRIFATPSTRAAAASTEWATMRFNASTYTAGCWMRPFRIINIERSKPLKPGKVHGCLRELMPEKYADVFFSCDFTSNMFARSNGRSS